MTESDSDFEMLEKRLSDLNPDELILVGLVHFTSEFITLNSPEQTDRFYH